MIPCDSASLGRLKMSWVSVVGSLWRSVGWRKYIKQSLQKHVQKAAIGGWASGERYVLPFVGRPMGRPQLLDSTPTWFCELVYLNPAPGITTMMSPWHRLGSIVDPENLVSCFGARS